MTAADGEQPPRALSISVVVDRLRRLRRLVLARADRLLPGQDGPARIAQSASYWADSSTPNWATNSHWRDGLEEGWNDIGLEHYARVRQAVRAAGGVETDQGPEFGRVIEWGCGGGANAVVFAPRSRAFVAADISESSLQECRRQVGRVTDVPLTTVLIDSGHPEGALPTIGAGSIDLFLCFYVFELLPSEEYALRVLRLSQQLLAPGGVAEIQVKYRTQDRRTRSMSRSYERNLARMTTFAIDEFWQEAADIGFEPLFVQLVPVNAFDERYAYFALRKPVA